MASSSHSGKARLEGSRVASNTARFVGGGIVNAGGRLRLIEAAVADNEAEDAGGISSGNARLRASTVSGNTATTGHGGGIVNVGLLALVASTVSGNTAATEGGGIWNSQGGPGPRGPIPPGTVTLDGASTATGNDPDDCVGTPACS